MHKFKIPAVLTLVIIFVLILFIFSRTSRYDDNNSYCKKYISKDGTMMSYTECNSDPLCTVTKQVGTPYSCGSKSESSINQETSTLTNESPNLYPRAVYSSMLTM